MRLLVPCHEYPPVGGGAGAACATLAEEYVRQGHEVTVLTMGLGNLPAHEEIDGVVVMRVACGRKHKEMSSAWEGLRWARRATSLATHLHAQQPFTAVHAHFIMPAGIVADRLQRSFGLPVVITAHGSDVPGYNRERLKLAHLLARPWWRSICHRADTIVCPSESLHKLLLGCQDGFRTTVIPYGFDVPRFQPLTKENKILLCSRLVERKGFQTFLEALRDLELDGWEVDLVGDGPMRPRLEKLARQCGTPVRLHGWIDNRDPRLVELYGRASIFVFPSEWENCPVALQEAMSAGCAIITTDVSGTKTKTQTSPGLGGVFGHIVAVMRDSSDLWESLANDSQPRTRHRISPVSVTDRRQPHSWPQAGAILITTTTKDTDHEPGI